MPNKPEPPMNSKSDTIDVKELVDFMQGVVYEYGRGQKHSPEYSEEDFGSSFNTKAFCKRKAKEIQALLLREREIGKAEGAREYAAFVAKDNVENPKSCVMPCCLAELSRLRWRQP